MNPTTVGSDPISLIAIVALLGLIPFLVIAGTSFLKFSIVLLVVRNAIGVQQVPPQIAVYAVALALCGFVMAPVAYDMAAQYNERDFIDTALPQKLEAAKKIVQPWKNYLAKNTGAESIEVFMDIAREHWPEKLRKEVDESHLVILLPSFMISELKIAFEIGFLIYIPFVVIDVVVSNILLALGMQMVAPMTFSMPLKLLLFVAVDGWGHLLRALAASVQY